MPLSSQYLSLCRRIAELRRNLLPATFDPTGNYTASDLDKTRGFVALVHAEIEHYVEDRCRFIANEAVQKWMATSNPIWQQKRLADTCG